MPKPGLQIDLQVNPDRYIDWSSLVDTLNLPPRAKVLPAKIPCFFCKTRDALCIYDDSTFNGHWWYCTDCQHKGTTFSTIQRLWGTSIDDTYARLRRHMVMSGENKQSRKPVNPASLKTFQREFLGHQKQMDRIIRNDWLPNKPEFRPELTRRDFDLFLPCYSLTDTSQAALDSGQHIFGMAGYDCKKIDKLCKRPERVLYKKRYSPDKPLLYIEQSAWLLPLRDMPGRITGFWMFNRDGERLVNIFGKNGLAAGAAYLAAANAQHELLNNHVFVTLDIPDAARLQSRNLTLSHKLLPLIGLDRQYRVPPYLQGALLFRPVIVLTKTIDIETIRIAKELNAEIVVYDKDLYDDDENPVLRNVAVKLKQLIPKAIPWKKVVEKTLPTLSLVDFLHLKRLLNLDNFGLNKLAEDWGKTYRDELERMEQLTGENSRVQRKHEHIVACDRGWVREKNQEVLTDMPFYLDYIVVDPARLSDTRVVGRAVYKGQVYPFDVPHAGLVWESAEAIYHNVMVTHKIAAGITINPINKLMGISLLFQKPKVMEVTSRMGWLPEANGFHLGSKLLTENGFELAVPGAATAARAALEYLPLGARNNQMKRARLSVDTPSTRFAITLAYAILDNEIRQALGKKTRLHYLVGPTAEALKPLLMALGCLREQDMGEFEARKHICHGWPIVCVTPHVCDSYIMQQADEPKRKMIYQCTREEAAAKTCLAPGAIIKGPKNLQVDDLLAETASMLLINSLKTFLRYMREGKAISHSKELTKEVMVNSDGITRNTIKLLQDLPSRLKYTNPKESLQRMFRKAEKNGVELFQTARSRPDCYVLPYGLFMTNHKLQGYMQAVFRSVGFNVQPTNKYQIPRAITLLKEEVQQFIHLTPPPPVEQSSEDSPGWLG